MKKFLSILKGVISVVFLLVLVVVACYVGVFALEKDSADKIYLYNHAFVAEKEEDGLHMWFVERIPFSELETGDGVIYYSDGGYRASRCEAGEDQPTFYRADDLSEEAAVTKDNYVGHVIAAW